MHTYTCCTAGTHLGHNLADKSGNRYCINLVSCALEKVATSKLLPRLCQRSVAAPLLSPLTCDSHVRRSASRATPTPSTPGASTSSCPFSTALRLCAAKYRAPLSPLSDHLQFAAVQFPYQSHVSCLVSPVSCLKRFSCSFQAVRMQSVRRRRPRPPFMESS